MSANGSSQEKNDAKFLTSNPRPLTPNPWPLIPILLILLVTALCFWNSLTGQFVGDDHIVVVRNETIKSFASLPKLFLQSYWGEGYAEQSNYRPLTNVSFALNYALGGLNPFGYHLLNLLLHALNGLLIYWLVLHYSRRLLLALFSALLFTAHPVHTEVVSQIAGRTELLAAALVLLAWITYCRREKDRRYYWLSLFIYFLALLAKESAIVLVGVLALADLCADWHDWREQLGRRLRGYGGYIAVAGIYILIRISVLNQIGVNPNAIFFKDASLMTRVFTMSQAFVKYFQLLVWPARLCADYDFSLIPKATALTARVGFSLGVVGLLFIAGIWLLRRERLSAFAILFFFITMSVVSNIAFPTGILIAERVVYIPAASICLLAGAGLDRLYQYGKWMRWAAVGLCALLLTAAGVRDYFRNLDWQDGGTYARALVRTAPNNPKSYLALGSYYSHSGQYPEAEAALKQAIALAPDKATTYGALGELYLQQERYEDALVELQRSLELYSRLGFVHIAMARVYNHRGEYAQAAEAFRRGIALSPPDASLHEELAVTLFRLGDRASAVAEFERAVKLKPDLGEAHSSLGLLLRSLGRNDEALTHLREAVLYDPKNATAHNDYGAALLDQGRLAEASNEFAAAIAINSRFAEAHNNLGVVYSELQRYEEARREFEVALRINPNYTNAAHNLEQLETGSGIKGR